jgi:N-acetylmuramoyl-L-alanine amidase
MWRTLRIAGILLMLLATPVSAEHSPHYDVTCPTGSADIVLDPGHGGSDPGAVNEEFNLSERDLNLEIARATADILRNQYGYSVALTREDNETELANSERGEIANACGARVLIEIHLNASTDTDANYAHVFWGEKEKDLMLTLVMSEAMKPLGIPVHTVDRFDNGGLLRAKMPSVLVEAVFLSNPDEAAKLADGTRQDEIAAVIASGIHAWMQDQT